MNEYNNQYPNFSNTNCYDIPDDQQQRCYVVINVADMIRETFNGIIALNASLGENFSQQPPLQQYTQIPQSVQSVNTSSSGQGRFIGVYNHNAYGVYDDPGKLADSLQYLPGYSTVTFVTYEEALSFAKNGIANVRGGSVNDIPDMRISINWTERL